MTSKRKAWSFHGGPFDGLSSTRPTELGIPLIYAVPISAATHISMGGGALNANNPRHREILLAGPGAVAEYHFAVGDRGGRYVFHRVVPLVAQPSEDEETT
jgi:hypothetical protein